MKKRKKLQLRKETLNRLDSGLLGQINAAAAVINGPNTSLNTCGDTCDGCDTTTCSVSHIFSECHGCGLAVAASDADS